MKPGRKTGFLASNNVIDVAACGACVGIQCMLIIILHLVIII